MSTMKQLETAGQSKVADKLDKATQDVEKIGKDFGSVKEGISDMPGGLDPDIAAAIKAVAEEGKKEASSDIEQVKSGAVAEAKKSADTIGKDVDAKIQDNKSAKSKLDSITSKYGKSARAKAGKTLDTNTNAGLDLKKMIEKAQADADKAIQNVKDNL